MLFGQPKLFWGQLQKPTIILSQLAHVSSGCPDGYFFRDNEIVLGQSQCLTDMLSRRQNLCPDGYSPHLT